MTCFACPEQYDIYDGDELVAYLRYRGGHLIVHPYFKDQFYPSDWSELAEGLPRQKIDFDTLIYEEYIGDQFDGSFEVSERAKRENKLGPTIQISVKESAFINNNFRVHNKSITLKTEKKKRKFCWK